MSEEEILTLFAAMQASALRNLEEALNSDDPEGYLLEGLESEAYRTYVAASDRAREEKHPRRKGGFTRHALKCYAEWQEAAHTLLRHQMKRGAERDV